MVLIMSNIINGQARTRANVRTDPNGIRSKTTAAKSPAGIRQHSNISMTNKYSRGDAQATADVMQIRSAARVNKAGRKTE